MLIVTPPFSPACGGDVGTTEGAEPLAHLKLSASPQSLIAPTPSSRATHQKLRARNIALIWRDYSIRFPRELRLARPFHMTDSPKTTLQKHKEFLFPAVATYYQEPLALVKGVGMHVWSDAGRPLSRLLWRRSHRQRWPRASDRDRRCRRTSPDFGSRFGALCQQTAIRFGREIGATCARRFAEIVFHQFGHRGQRHRDYGRQARDGPQRHHRFAPFLFGPQRDNFKRVRQRRVETLAGAGHRILARVGALLLPLPAAFGVSELRNRLRR